jgi:2-haloacid dehalogenase
MPRAGAAGAPSTCGTPTKLAPTGPMRILSLRRLRSWACGVVLRPNSATRYSELQPWPGTLEALSSLTAAGVALGIVTNCSERLGRIAADRLEVDFAVIVTAERAGFYKPDPRPYRLALEELKVDPERCLFVAGSAYDLAGTAKVGMPTYWHDRIGMAAPEGVPAPLLHETSLKPLLPLVLNPPHLSA